MANSSWRNALQRVKNTPRDELYTMRESIDEVFQYFPDGLFKDKSILCPCDGPASKFVEFFKDKWAELGISRLVCVVFNAHSHGQFMVMTDPQKEEWHDLFGHGDFRDEETLKYWQEADFIITNPPFSLAHDFIKRCYNMDKLFCVVGNIMISLYNRVFPRMFSGELKVILAKNHTFTNYAGEKFELDNGCWLSNMPSLYKPPVYHIKRTKAENEALGYVYKRYDNYDAIEVSHLKYLPSDYEGVMGVPITVLSYDYSDYKILGMNDCHANYDISPTKRYGAMEFWTHDKNGKRIMKIRTGENNTSCIEVDEGYSGNYYKELNSDKKLRSCFRRVFIQKRKADE